MKTSIRRTWPVALAALLGLCLSSFVEAQSPNADPFNNRANTREARLAYLASQRAKAAVPVNYSFPVRADAATAYNAAAYSPRYQYSMRPSYGNPSTAYRPAANPYANYAPSSYHADGRSCPLSSRPFAAQQRPTLPLTTQRPVDPYLRAAYAPANPYASARYGAANPYAAGAHTAPSSYATGYPGAAIQGSRTQVDPYHYVGSSAAGPPKVYPKDEPVRNFFRYLFP